MRVVAVLAMADAEVKLAICTRFCALCWLSRTSVLIDTVGIVGVPVCNSGFNLIALSTFSGSTTFCTISKAACRSAELSLRSPSDDVDTAE